MKKYMYATTILFLCLLQLIAGNGYAQQLIQGRVTDAKTGETLPGVNIVVKGTIRGTITDLDGDYFIELQVDDTVLEFTYTGFENVEVVIGTQRTINVSMNEKSEMLDEIVVIGYGTVRKSDLTGSVSSVKEGDIKKTTSNNAIQALQGKVAGVHITTTSGAPGAGASVRIRGWAHSTTLHLYM